MFHSSFLILLAKNPAIVYVDLIITKLDGSLHITRCKVKEMESIVNHGLSLPQSLFLNDGTAKQQQILAWPVAPVRIPMHVEDDFKENSNHGHGQDAGLSANVAEVLMSMTTQDGHTPFIADSRQALKNVLPWFNAKRWQLHMGVRFNFVIASKQGESIENEWRKAKQALEAIFVRQQIPATIEDNSVVLRVSNNLLQVADYVVMVRHIMNTLLVQRGLCLDVNTSSFDFSVYFSDEKGESLSTDSVSYSLLHFAKNGMQSYLQESTLVFNANNYNSTDEIASRIFEQKDSNDEPYLCHQVASANSNIYLSMTYLLAALQIGVDENLRSRDLTNNGSMKLCEKLGENLAPLLKS